MQFMSKFFRFLVKACPYSVLGKKSVGFLKGTSSRGRGLKSKTEVLKSGIKTGRNILLVGLFCPFLWYSILTGSSRDFIIFNVVHSGIIVGLGFLILSVNYVMLYQHIKLTKKG